MTYFSRVFTGAVLILITIIMLAVTVPDRPYLAGILICLLVWELWLLFCNLRRG